MRRFLLPIIVLLLCIAPPASAQEHDNNAYLASFKDDFNGSSKKLVDLAGAFSEEMYAWRPAEGVRSVSEVYVHVAQANFGLASALGAEMPADWPEDAEKAITSKDDVVMWLEKSQKHVHEMLGMVTTVDLGGTVQFYGNDMSRFRILSIIAGHSHEHLGQAIAYARSNGVTPPWSQSQ